MPFAELSDVRCHYELLGTGDPVLLIPGLGTTGNLWDCVVPELSPYFSLILVDKRDVGRSVSKRPPQTLVDYTVDLIELMDYLQLDRAHVIGLSLGGIIAQRLAVDHPSRIDRLVLISCGHRFGPYLREMAKLLGQALYHFKPALFRRTVELLGSSPQYFDAHIDEIEAKIASAAQVDVGRAAVLRELRCLGCHDAVSDDYRITAPTLVIAGEQDMLIPPCYDQQMADEIPGSQFVLVPGSGHNPLTEKPEFVIPCIRNFLARRDVAASREGQETQRVVEEAV